MSAVIFSLFCTFASAAEETFLGKLATIVEPATAKQLEINEETLAKLNKLVDDREKLALDLSMQIKKLSPEEQAAKLAPFRAESESLALKLLSDKQLKQLEQIQWDRRGPLSFADADIANKMLFNPSQIERIKALIEEFNTKSPAQSESTRKAMKADYETQILNVLTDRQRTVWEGMTGRAVAKAITGNNLAQNSSSNQETKGESRTGSESASPKGNNPSGSDSSSTGSSSSGRRTNSGPKKETLQFTFRYAPWRNVIEWFAEQAGYSLLMEVPPVGTFNYQDSKEYTPAEALDLLNSVLITKGYVLVRRERMLMLVNLQDGIPQVFVPFVAAEDLDKHGNFELVNTIFTLERMAPEEAVVEIGKLIDTTLGNVSVGKIVTLPRAHQIMVTETVGRMKTIKAVIDGIERPQQSYGEQFKPLALKHITPSEALVTIKQLMNIPPDRNSTADGTVRLVLDNTNKTLLVGGKPDMISRIEDILKVIDVPNSLGRGDGVVQFETYSVGSLDPTTALNVLKIMLSSFPDAGTPNLRVDLEPNSNNLLVSARPSVHATIKATLEQMQKDSRTTEVFRLRLIDPVQAEQSINKVFEGAPVGTAPKVVAEPTQRQLMVRGTKAQIAQIESILKQAGEFDIGTSDTANSQLRDQIRVVPITGKTAKDIIAQMEQFWPKTNHKNKIQFVTPSANRSNDQSANPTGLFDQSSPYNEITEKRLSASAPSNNAGQAGPLAPAPYIQNVPTHNSPNQANANLDPHDVLGIPRPDPAVNLPPAHRRTIEMTPAQIEELQKILKSRFQQEPQSQPQDSKTPQLNPPSSQNTPAPTTPTTNEQDPSAKQPQQTLPTSRTTLIPSWSRTPVRFVADEKTSPVTEQPAKTGQDLEEGKAATPPAANGEEPPILISIGPGGLIIACDDKQALDDFELLLKTLLSRTNKNQREYTVFYLKYAKAQGVAELIEQIFSTGPSSSGTGSAMSSLASNMFGGFGGGLMGDMLGFGGGGDDAPAKLSGSGTISIVPDIRLNALIVQANTTDLDTMEQLLKVIDQPHSPEEVLLVSKPRLIQVYYTSAEEMAKTVNAVYADRMAANPNVQRQPDPRELLQALRGGGGRRGEQQKRAEQDSPKLTIGVDARTNSLVVTAPEQLFKEVKELVESLDKETPANAETIRVVTIKNANPSTVQQSLSQIVGASNVKSSGTSSTNTSTQNRNPTQALPFGQQFPTGGFGGFGRGGFGGFGGGGGRGGFGGGPGGGRGGFGGGQGGGGGRGGQGGR